MTYFPQKEPHWTAKLVDAVIYTAAVIGILIALAFAFLLISIKTGRAHHWYDPECCSGRDCFPVEAQVIVLPNGSYFIPLTQETFAHPDSADHPRARWSKDNRFHRCTANGDRNALASLCLYVPPPGS